MVAHQQATEGESCFHCLIGMFIPYLHFFIIVLQVRAVGICAQVAPFTYYGIAEVAIMCLVAIGKEYGIVYLSSHFTTWSQRGSAIYLGPHLYHAVFAHGQWSAYH